VYQTLDQVKEHVVLGLETTDGSKAKKTGKSKMPRTSRFDEQDYRDLTLRLNRDTVQVHYARGITFDCELF
jgi:hypothetical protein